MLLLGPKGLSRFWWIDQEHGSPICITDEFLFLNKLNNLGNINPLLVAGLGFIVGLSAIFDIYLCLLSAKKVKTIEVS